MAATATTTADALWDVLYAWASGVLPGVQVVPSHEDAPSPEGNFVCIDYAGTWHFAGTAPSKRIEGRPDLPSPNVYVYRGSVQVRDVDGNGDNLMRLVESLDEYGVLTAFADAGISVLKTNGPVAMPALQQTKWRRESVLTLEMTWARANEGTTLTIESVEITQVETAGTIDSEENLIVDDQRNILQSEQIKYKLKIETEEATNGT